MIGISDRTSRLFIRLDAKVTISEIGACLWTGPYLEALNIVIEEQGSIEIRQVQMLLDLPASESSQPVIDQLVLDEEVIQRGSARGTFPDPQTWALLLDQLHEIVRPMGDPIT